MPMGAFEVCVCYMSANSNHGYSSSLTINEGFSTSWALSWVPGEQDDRMLALPQGVLSYGEVDTPDVAIGDVTAMSEEVLSKGCGPRAGKASQGRS